MKYSYLLMALLMLVISTGTPSSSSAPKSEASSKAQEEYAQDNAAASWSIESRFDTSLLTFEGEPLATVSVSPSGQTIAAVDRSKPSVKDRHAAGIPNSLGRLPEALFLFSRNGSAISIPISVEEETELSSTFGGGAEMAWNADETRCIVSITWRPETLIYFNTTHSNLYLLDLADGSFRRLTQNSEPLQHCYSPIWTDSSTIRYLRLTREDNDLVTTLCELDLETGAERTIATLYHDGPSALVTRWRQTDTSVYYTFETASTVKLMAAPIGGDSAEPQCLIDQMEDLRQTDLHPYCRGFSALDVSEDGRWLCLTLTDMRLARLDFPFADSEETPQSDPANAVSTTTHQPWVPCHNVILYNLIAGRMVDPFTAPSLAPTESVVAAACFTPDGRSLLCAVFGDGKPWTMEDTKLAAFYRVDLHDGYAATRLFETELYSSLSFPEGLRWEEGGPLIIPTDQLPNTPAQLLWLKRE